MLFLIDDVQSVVVALTRLAGVAELSAPSEPARLTETADASVKVTSLRYAYVSGHEVLTDVDLSLTAGERVALVGANGAGKTTLAKIMAGVRHPTAGEVRLLVARASISSGPRLPGAPLPWSPKRSKSSPERWPIICAWHAPTAPTP